MELRYIIRRGWDGPERVLQFRVQRIETDYSATDSTGTYLTTMVWAEWTDVPVVKD